MILIIKEIKLLFPQKLRGEVEADLENLNYILIYD